VFKKNRNFRYAADAIEADAMTRESDRGGRRAATSRADSDLLARFCGGDPDAFTQVYRMQQAAVFRFARLMTGDAAKAAEVTQDVFVWLIHHAAEFDPARGELSAFLIGVTRKFLLRRRDNEMRWVPLNEDSLAAHDEPDEYEGDSDTEALRRAIAALPLKYREVVVLCDLEGKSYEESAAVAGCAVGTVRSRLHRARALLARKLELKAGRKVERCSV
jgi:RNA polymerase sigma-70 factor (ECF subfamily)